MSVAVIFVAPVITWLLVMTSPPEVTTMPVAAPSPPSRPSSVSMSTSPGSTLEVIEPDTPLAEPDESPPPSAEPLPGPSEPPPGPRRPLPPSGPPPYSPEPPAEPSEPPGREGRYDPNERLDVGANRAVLGALHARCPTTPPTITASTTTGIALTRMPRDPPVEVMSMNLTGMHWRALNAG